MLRVEELRKTYPTGIINSRQYKVLDKVSFTIAPGETLGLVGESGCGKSTLARVMLGLIPPSSGKIFFKGQEVVSDRQQIKKEMRSKIQIIFQHPECALNPRMNIYKSLIEPMVIQNQVLDRDGLKREMNDLLEQVGLCKEHLNRYPHELSGGQIQRVVLARILSLKPNFIVADEPTSMLDVSVQAQVLQILKKIQMKYKMGLLFISHDLELVNWMSDRIAVMYKGQIVEIASADEICKNPMHPYSCLLVEAFSSLQHPFFETSPLIANSTTTIVHGCSYAGLCPKAKKCCQQKPMLRQKSENHYVACWLA